MAVSDNTSKKLIYFRERLADKKSDEQFADQILYELKERAEKKAIEESDELIQRKIALLEKENKKMEVEIMRKQVKLQMCIPSEMLMCLCTTIIIITACVTILFFQIVANVKIIDYYLVIFALVGGIGLLHTSITTFKNWRRYITDEGES